MHRLGSTRSSLQNTGVCSSGGMLSGYRAPLSESPPFGRNGKRDPDRAESFAIWYGLIQLSQALFL